MATQTPPNPPTTQRKSLRPLYWIAAAAMLAATVLSAVEKADWMAITGRVALLAALVLLATAKDEETKAKKLLIYALAAISLGLWLARVMNR